MKKWAYFTITILLMSSFAGNNPVLAHLAASVDPQTPPAKPDSISKGSLPDNFLQSEEFQLSPADSTGNRYLPQIAYNTINHEYLVVWHLTRADGGREIWARRVSSTGQLLSAFCVASGFGTGGDGKNRFRPAVAFNSQRGEYLVVYMYEDSAYVYQVWGRVIPWNGPGTNPEKLIFSWANRSIWGPRLAYNSTDNEYLVVWNSFNTTSSFPPGFPNDIGGTRVDYHGDVINPGLPFSWTSTDYPNQVDLAYNPTYNQYLVVYVVEHSTATTSNDIDALHISSLGAIVDPPGIKHIAQNTEDENHPAVATDGVDSYVVSWDMAINSWEHDIWSVTYNWTNNGAIMVFPLDFLDDDTLPDVSYNSSGDWLLVWQRALSGGDYSIQARWYSEDAIVPFDIASYSFWQNQAPAVAAGGSGYLTAYEGVSSITNRHIYGVLWSPNALFLPVVRK